MIYDFENVIVVSFTDDKDAYGQPHKTESSRREVEMMIRNFVRAKVEDVRFVDATDIGLTFDTEITDANQIIATSGTYDVLYVIPSHRLNQVFMKKVK